MLEKVFQRELKKDLQRMFPGAIIIKMDALEIQGIPDLLILYNEKWAALECKQTKGARHRPNQDFYVDKLNKMSFASFIYPENKEEVLDELYNYLA
jgi:hypothetical protein